MYKATHIDTCLSCYLLDHHNREGELLLGSIVDGSTSYASVLDDLQMQIDSVDVDGFDYDKAANSLVELFADVPDMTAAFDSSLDVIAEEDSDDMTEPCQAWILIKWDTEEESE